MAVVASRYVMDFAGRFHLPAAPLTVWAEIERLDQFERWWAWLGELEIDGDGLRDGSVLRGTVAPPVPYRMHVEIELCHCVRPCQLDAHVTGDLAGEAHLALEPAGSGTLTEVWWSLEMLQAPMRIAARVAYPLLRWGHDRVVDATVSGFRSHLERLPR